MVINMIKDDQLNELLSIFSKEMRNIYNDKIVDIILFGSFAEGVQDYESDIDVMVLVDLDDNELEKYFKKMIEVVSRLDLEYNVVLSPIIQNYQQYKEYLNVLPFFKNVSKGVKIGA